MQFIVYQQYQYSFYMKNQIDDSNYQAMISKLAKGSIEQKSQSLKKLLFLYENARSRIYLYERRITECLELSLLIQEKDISLNALNMLQKIIVNTSAESDIMQIIKKRLLSKMILNLGSVQVAVRKVSHRCILQFVRKFKDFEIAMTMYLKTALQQNQNSHLKLKAINSFHSLLMAEIKYFTHDLQCSKILLEQLIHSSHQKQYIEIKRSAQICLIFVIKINGVQNNLKSVSSQTENELNQLRYQNQELALLLDSIFKINHDTLQQMDNQPSNVPSPKFISIQETAEIKNFKHQMSADPIIEKMEKISEIQMKIYNEVSFAQDFLKKIQTEASIQFNQVQEYAPFLQKCLIDESIKLFSISKKIVQVIFNSEDGNKKEYYIVLVPCIVNGIGNKRFLVRKNLDKLVRLYVKNHTEIWVQNFVQRFAMTKNYKVKQILIDLLTHAYKTSPEFYYPTNRTFEIFDYQMNDSNSSIKRKILDCIVIILQKHAKDEKSRELMLQIFSADPYSKIIRKIGRNNSIGSLSQEGQVQTLEPLSPVIIKKERKQRLVTAQPQKQSHLEKSQEKDTHQNISEEKYKIKALVPYSRDKKVRNSHIQINFKIKKSDRRSKDDKQKTSLQKLPELKKPKNSAIISKHQLSQSPIKKSLGERNITYVQRQHLKPLQNPKSELQRCLIQIKDNNWAIQFDSINKLRSIIQFNKEMLGEELLAYFVNQLLSCLNNLRSGVTKLALMCLNEMMKNFNKKIHHFTENIIVTIIKKSITTSEFMQDQIKKCISAAVEELNLPKIISALNSVKQSKSNDIKITFLLFLEIMIKNQKIYKKQNAWIWAILIQFNEQPHFNLRNQCKRLVKTILQSYKDWKNDVIQMRKEDLQKIDKLLKNLNQKGQNNLWIQIQNHQFQKIILNRIMTSKYFTNNYTKFQDLDKNYTIKKNWKERIKLLNDIFQTAFEYPAQFQANSNIKKYFTIAIEQIDEKNPGLLINALNNLHKSIQYFPGTIEECIGAILQKTVCIFNTNRGELITMANKMLTKIYSRYDVNKIIKQYLKLLSSSSKQKNEIVNQLMMLLKQNDGRQLQNRSIKEIQLERNIINIPNQLNINQNSQNIIMKSLIKLCSDKNVQNNHSLYAKIKDLIVICQRRFGPQFSNKILANPKIMEIMP